MKVKNNAGFSLVECLVAITVMGIVVTAICGSMITSGNVNVKAEAMLREELVVSSVVETLMAEGILADALATYETRFEGVDIHLEKESPDDYYYNVTVSAGSYEIETFIREVGGGR